MGSEMCIRDRPFNKGYVPEINLDEGYIIVASTGMVFLEDGEDSEEC